MKPLNRVGHRFAGIADVALILAASCYLLILHRGGAGNPEGAALTGFAALIPGVGIACAIPERARLRLRGGRVPQRPAGDDATIRAARALSVCRSSRRRALGLVALFALALVYGGSGQGAHAGLAPPSNVVAVPAECSSVSPLSFGTDPTAGAIDPAGQTDCWRFDDAAGDRVRVRLIVTSGTLSPALEVLRPNGTTIPGCGPTGLRDFSCPLDATGTHTILVRDTAGTNTGNYQIAIQRLNNDTDPPETSIDSGPSGATSDPTPTFAFSADEPGSTLSAASTAPHLAAARRP